MLLALLFTSAFASPLTGSCPALADGRAVLVDGATLEWGGRSFSCDGERTCDVSLPADSANFDSTGLVAITFDCGPDQIELSCRDADCTLARLPSPDLG